MTANLSITLAALLGALAAVAHAATEPRIKLTPSSDRVIPIEQRETVLEVSRELTARGRDGIGTEVASLDDPFQFREEAVAATPDRPATITRVRASDEAVLNLVAQQFRGLVKGYMERNGRTYLQLKGGKLLPSDSRIPIHLPAMPEGGPVEVTIGAVTPRTYELRINDASVKANMPGYDSINTDTIQRSPDPAAVPDAPADPLDVATTRPPVVPPEVALQ